tara:strand:+ start:472 stop:1218 length:747 start_codon:yes stop_codon:yes gene_type:complete
VPKLSVTVITKNEKKNLAYALESVSWADELIVVDCGSEDGTADIARRFTDHVFVRSWTGYGDQKNYAAEIASHDWIFSLDADERVPHQLAQEIRQLLETEPAHRGYRVPRVTFHLGRWIRSTDWYPDFQLRLYDRRAGRWSTPSVHESVTVSGRVGRFQHELEHYTYRDLSHQLDTIDRYATLAADDMVAQGRRTSFLRLVVHPILAFLRNYLLRGGMRDGVAGFIISTMNAYYVFLKFAKLWERQRH